MNYGCFLVSLTCGDTNSENNSYITQASFTSLTTNPCKIDICPCSSDICRIRYDFSVSAVCTYRKLGNRSHPQIEAVIKCNFYLVNIGKKFREKD